MRHSKSYSKPSAEAVKLGKQFFIRGMARLFDLALVFIILELISALRYPIFTNSYHRNIMITGFAWFLIEPIFLTISGTTPGKFLSNIKLREINNKNISYINAAIRSFKVWCVGLGFLLPVVYLFTLWYCRRQFIRTGTTYWDKNKFTVSEGKSIPLIALTLTFAVYWWVSYSQVMYQKRIETLYKNPENYLNAVAEENAKLPMHFLTLELYKISFENKTLTYYYKINNYSKSTDTPIQTNVNPKLHRTNTCRSGLPYDTLILGYKLTVNIVDANNNTVENTTMTINDCK